MRTVRCVYDTIVFVFGFYRSIELYFGPSTFLDFIEYVIVVGILVFECDYYLIEIIVRLPNVSTFWHINIDNVSRHEWVTQHLCVQESIEHVRGINKSSVFVSAERFLLKELIEYRALITNNCRFLSTLFEVLHIYRVFILWYYLEWIMKPKNKTSIVWITKTNPVFAISTPDDMWRLCTLGIAVWKKGGGKSASLANMIRIAKDKSCCDVSRIVSNTYCNNKHLFADMDFDEENH